MVVVGSQVVKCTHRNHCGAGPIAGQLLGKLALPFTAECRARIPRRRSSSSAPTTTLHRRAHALRRAPSRSTPSIRPSRPSTLQAPVHRTRTTGRQEEPEALFDSTVGISLTATVASADFEASISRDAQSRACAASIYPNPQSNWLFTARRTTTTTHSRQITRL